MARGHLLVGGGGREGEQGLGALLCRARVCLGVKCAFGFVSSEQESARKGEGLRER